MMNENYEDEEISPDEILDSEEMEQIEKNKEENENKSNDEAIRIARLIQKGTNSRLEVVDGFAKDIAGKKLGDSGGVDETIPNERGLDPVINSKIEKIGLLAKMSNVEVERLKDLFRNKPRYILDGIDNYYSINVEPLLQNRESMLKDGVLKRKGQNAAVFLYISNSQRDPNDGTFTENQKVVAVDLEKRPSFKIYHNQIVQQMSPEQTPFSSPSILFAETESKNLPQNKM